MRSSKSRSRSKSNRQRTLGNIINRVFDSSGPEGKVRGTPQQIIDKYLALARDAQLSHDRVAEQSFLQHAEHYTRLLGEAQREMASRQAQGSISQPVQGHRIDHPDGVREDVTAPPADAASDQLNPAQPPQDGYITGDPSEGSAPPGGSGGQSEDSGAAYTARHAPRKARQVEDSCEETGATTRPRGASTTGAKRSPAVTSRTRSSTSRYSKKPAEIKDSDAVQSAVPASASEPSS